MRKGGNGKSTSCQNLGAAIALKGYKVLVVDLDEQGNTSSTMDIGFENQTVEEVLCNENEEIKKELLVKWEGLELLGTKGGLSGAAKSIDKELASHNILKEKLKKIKEDYDYILIDTSPNLNILTINALCACGYVFIPMSTKYYSNEGLLQTTNSIEKVQEKLNYDLDLLGVAIVIHDGRSTLAKEVSEEVGIKNPSVLFKNLINQNIKIEEAQVKGMSIFTYAPKDRGALQYMALTEEILERIKEEEDE